jgi:HlyD family secretion protein/epimerase transport system membrane fusion protein
MSRMGAYARGLLRADGSAAAGEPVFDPSGNAENSEIIRLRLRRPIVVGSIITLVLVLGLLIWASVASVSGAVVATGTVSVQDNLKQLRYRDGGIVRQIFVHEGDLVHRGQVLLRFDKVTNQATVDIYQNTYDTALAEIARYQAEATNARTISFPAALLARSGDPRAEALMEGQRSLFQTRMMLYRSQAEVLGGQIQQLQTQIGGMRAQQTALGAQSALIDDELKGVSDLNKLGYAPRSRLLALQRSAAEIKGQRGAMTSDMGRVTQQMGAVRLQIAQLDDKRQTDAADGLATSEQKLTDAMPKLRAAQESLSGTDVVAPVDGYVFNLAQTTEGGVAQPGETLMQIVPINQPLEIVAMVKPTDIAEVRVGLPARVTLTAYNPRTTPEVDGTVSLVSADAGMDQTTHATFYTVRVKVAPKDLARAGKDVHLSPGMPANVSIITSSRTIMTYLLSPILEPLRSALRER